MRDNTLPGAVLTVSSMNCDACSVPRQIRQWKKLGQRQEVTPRSRLSRSLVKGLKTEGLFLQDKIFN